MKNKILELKTNLALIVLALADVVIMAIPFYLENYIPNLYGKINLSASDYSFATSIFGLVAIPFYIFGAYIGDKFKSKNLIIISLFLTTLLGLWYLALPIIAAFNSNPDITKYQLYIIFGIYAFAICGLFWAPLWKLVKNHNTEMLVGFEKEKKVGKNNGYQGTSNGLIGLILALLGLLILQLGSANFFPVFIINGSAIDLGFFVLVSTYILLTFTAMLLAIFYIKEPKAKEVSFSLNSLYKTIKNGYIWLLGFLLFGVYVLQMGLSSYINYLNNIFWINPVIVIVIGIFRTYVMRFLISKPFGKRADHYHSYILLICIGIVINVVLLSLAILLPQFLSTTSNLLNNTWTNVLIQVVACSNLILIGAITWALVTIRWSPIGSELKIENDNYASAVNIISVIAFSPDVFFRLIRAWIEANHNMTLPDGTIVADATGNQMILGIVVAFALFGLASGALLYYLIYRKKRVFVPETTPLV